MKFKVLKDFISSIVNGIEGKIHDLELDEPTAKMWIEHKLIEEVKDEPAPVIAQEEAPSAPTTEATSEPTQKPEAPTQGPEPTQEPTQEPAPEVTPAPEAVTADENK